MASPSPTEASLISKLQSSDSTGIYALVSDYLRPFSDLNNSNSNQTLIRSLAKRFLPFLNTSLSILPKRLPRISTTNSNIIDEFFLVYSLCLDCLDVVSSQLASKPFQVHFQRLRFIHCSEDCSRLRHAEAECLAVLDKLRSVKRKGKILPEIDKDGGDDKDLCSLVVQIVVSMVRCAAADPGEDDGQFRRVLQLVEEVRPWLR